MNPKLMVLTAGLLIAATTVKAQTKKSMQQKTFTTEENTVMQVILDMTDYFHKKDINGVLASYEPNALIIFEPENPVSGMDAIKQGFMDFFAINPKFEYSGHEIFINGTFAMHFAPWTMTGKAPDGTKIMQSGLSVALLRKQQDGKWLMVFDNPFGQHLMDQQ